MSPQMGIVTDADLAAAIVAHAADLDAHTRNYLQTLRTGEYYWPDMPGASTQGLTANFLCASPLIVARDITVDRIAIDVTTADAGKVARLGIYNLGVNLAPGTLLLDAGVVSLNAVGVQALVINQALPKGIYFPTLVCDSNAALLAATDIPYRISSRFLGLNPTDFQKGNGWWTVAQAYGVLPDPFTAGAALSGALKLPVIAVRVLSLD